MLTNKCLGGIIILSIERVLIVSLFYEVCICYNIDPYNNDIYYVE